MSTVALGPYEHRGAYADSEFFETSGMPIDFCDWCEHAPCVAGGRHWCGNDPRFISVEALVDAITDAMRRQDEVGLRVALRIAVGHLAAIAWRTGWDGDQELKHLAQVHEYLLKHLREGADS